MVSGGEEGGLERWKRARIAYLIVLVLQVKMSGSRFGMCGWRNVWMDWEVDGDGDGFSCGASSASWRPILAAAGGPAARARGRGRRVKGK